MLLLVGLALYGRYAHPFGLFIVSSALVLSLLALSVDLQWGYAGILNLGPAAYLGLGAYTYALVQRKVAVGSPTWLAFGLAVMLGIALAVVVAYPAFKARTLPAYYALITLAVALILQRWTAVSYDLTGGSNGITGIRLPDFSLPGLNANVTTTEQFFLLASGVVIVVYLGLLWLTRSRFGRVMAAIRDDEEKVATLGYDVAGAKLVVAAIAGALGALAGALYAPLIGTAHPSLFGIAFTIQAYRLGGRRRAGDADRPAPGGHRLEAAGEPTARHLRRWLRDGPGRRLHPGRHLPAQGDRRAFRTDGVRCAQAGIPGQERRLPVRGGRGAGEGQRPTRRRSRAEGSSEGLNG